MSALSWEHYLSQHSELLCQVRDNNEQIYSNKNVCLSFQHSHILVTLSRRDWQRLPACMHHSTGRSSIQIARAEAIARQIFLALLLLLLFWHSAWKNCASLFSDASYVTGLLQVRRRMLSGRVWTHTHGFYGIVADICVWIFLL